MSVLDDMRGQGNDIMKDSDAREKIQRIAYEHGMTLSEAKIHFMRQQDK